MTTKLTLTIENGIIKMAKTYAQRNGKSLSEVIENYLRTLVSKQKPEPESLSPRAKRLAGAVKLPSHLNYKKTLTEEISKKHHA